MRKTIRPGSWVIACLGSLLLSTHAEAAPRYIGKMVVTATSGTCSFGSDPTGLRRKMHFLPANVGDNGPDSSLSIIQDWSAENFLLANASFDSTLRTVAYTGISAKPFSQSPVSVRFTSQSPATILPTTNFINVVGFIRGWIGGPACNAFVRLSLARAAD